MSAFERSWVFYTMKTIPLTQGKVALVDDDLFDAISAYKWRALKVHKTFYAMHSIYSLKGKQTNIYMHRQIFKLKGVGLPAKVDHQDRNGLNNQWHNLRPVNNNQSNQNRGKNSNNTSGYIGVSRSREKWHVKAANKSGQVVSLGSFDNPVTAAHIYDAFVLLNRGEFAVTNF